MVSSGPTTRAETATKTKLSWNSRVEVALAFVASSIAPLRAIFFARATARDARSEAMVVVSPAVVATSAVASSASDARAPLIVLPEAAAFPPDFSAPWSRVVAPDARDDATAAPASPAPAKPPLAVAGATAACRVAALPAPLIPLGAGADAALHPRARDVDAEVGAHPDTLRALGACAGDLVEIRCASANRTRVGRLVAAERWRTPDDDGARGEESDGDDASDGDGHDGHDGPPRARIASPRERSTSPPRCVADSTSTSASPRYSLEEAIASRRPPRTRRKAPGIEAGARTGARAR